MSNNMTDVVIVGAGPVGLMLATELALAGVRPVVVDRLDGPSQEPRANGLAGQVIRVLDMRGLYNKFSGRTGPPQPATAFRFSGVPLDLTLAGHTPLYLLPIPQPRLVRLLLERAHELGVKPRWGHEIAELSRDGEQITVTLAGPAGDYQLTTRYLVGADGGKSLVRKSIGIDFPGTTSASVSRLGHVSVPAGWKTADGGLDMPGVGLLRFGANRLDRGWVAFGEIEPGRPLLAVTEFPERLVPQEEPMTFDELRESLRHVVGVDVPISPPTGPGPHALRRIAGQNTRLAERYNNGNIFLAGDAAHVHSGMGGPGLNLGLQDAVNLGWKLAATINGTAPNDLLDTYHSERHPAGQRVMMSSLAQAALMTPGPEISALRVLVNELLAIPDSAAHIAALMTGSDIRYDTGDIHPLSGYMVPDLTLRTEQGNLRVAELLHPAKPTLLDFTATHQFAGVTANLTDRVHTLTPKSPSATASALLIRPDGYVAWAADGPGTPESERLGDALAHILA
jgi:2-polyprenyl-6-methoxyphenol hydroxylase-like FAD-dependent oxidoreductase